FCCGNWLYILAISGLAGIVQSWGRADWESQWLIFLCDIIDARFSCLGRLNGFNSCAFTRVWAQVQCDRETQAQISVGNPVLALFRCLIDIFVFLFIESITKIE